MDWTLSLEDRIARARTDLRLGVPVVLRGASGDALVFAADGLTEKNLAAVKSPELAITGRRAETLHIRVYNGELARIALPKDVTAAWVASLADPTTDLGSPLRGPFQSVRDDQADTARAALLLAKSARLLPAVVLGEAPEEAGDLTVLNTEGMLQSLSSAVSHTDVVSGRVPLAVAQQSRVHVFRPDDASEDHVACEIGKPSRHEPVLVRLHSACFTGDVLGSRKCDCGAQLQGALAQMGQIGQGVLLYLSQEGRGIGLANKLRAYALQDQGFDTVEANHRLGYEDDERDFRTGADILKRLGLTKIRLLTNNPAKVGMMEAHGIEVVERVPLRVGRHDDNARYLDTKAKKSGHLL